MAKARKSSHMESPPLFTTFCDPWMGKIEINPWVLNTDGQVCRMGDYAFRD